MAIDFPASPSIGQTFVVGTVTYTWDGVKWTAVAAGGGATDKIEEGNTSAEVIDTGSDGRFVVTTEGSEALRVDPSGRLLVGTDTARGNFFNSSVSSVLQIEGTSNNPSRTASIINNSTSDDQAILVLGKSSGASVGSNTLVASGNTIGSISFQGNDGAEFVACASIDALIDGTPSANDMPGRIVLSTTADGANSPTERMRIDSNGFVNIGAYTIPSATPGMQLYGAGNLIFCKRSDTGEAISFYANSTTKVGNIVLGASSTTYVTSSDYRLKENVVPLTGAADRIKQIPVHRFNFIVEPDKTVDGFLAHEAQAVVPECVTGTKDEVDADGNPVYQGIDQSKLVPLITAALQEALHQIETQAGVITALNARITALEAN